jgi:hypothetical protein
MKKDDLLKLLVENGFDFLSRSIDELVDSPKYSVIHFYSAVELLVKARLMAEHWSLIVSKRQEPDMQDFIGGNFQSVTLDEAANRLQKVVQSGLSDQELQSFRNVRKHRNKMVHFFHEAHSHGKNDELRRTIAKEQLNAWYLLHRLLTGRWRCTFEHWSSRINEIDTALRKHHIFLQVVFDHAKPEIARLKTEGYLFEKCPSCGFDSQQHENVVEELYQSHCLVCGLSDNCLMLNCPECEELVRFVNEGSATCSSCNEHIDHDEVAKALIDEVAAYRAAKEGDDSWNLGNCSDCDGYHTVVRLKDDTYLCVSCFEKFDSLNWCEWCNELNTGDMEDSYLTGCNHCDGKVGWDEDD